MVKQFILLLLFLCSSLSNAAIDWVVVGKSQNNQLITEIRHTLPKDGTLIGKTLVIAVIVHVSSKTSGH